MSPQLSAVTTSSSVDLVVGEVDSFDRSRWVLAPARAQRWRLERMLNDELDRLGIDEALVLECNAVQERQMTELVELVWRLRARV